MKKIFSVILILSLIFTCFLSLTANAASGYCYLVTSTDREYYADGDTLTLTIRLDDSTGCRINPFISCRLKVYIPHYIAIADYREHPLLTPIEVKDISNGKFGTINYSPDLNVSDGALYIVFENDLLTKNNPNIGDLVQVTFKINYPCTSAEDRSLHTYIETTDVDLKTTLNETWTNFRVTPVLIGDINKDGTVSQTDRIILTRYLAGWDTDTSKYSLLAADIDGDGKVTQADRTLLSRYVANWEGYDKYFSK